MQKLKQQIDNVNVSEHVNIILIAISIYILKEKQLILYCPQNIAALLSVFKCENVTEILKPVTPAFDALCRAQDIKRDASATDEKIFQFAQELQVEVDKLLKLLTSDV